MGPSLQIPTETVSCMPSTGARLGFKNSTASEKDGLPHGMHALATAAPTLE